MPHPTLLAAAAACSLVAGGLVLGGCEQASSKAPSVEVARETLPFDRYLYEQARQGQFSGSALVALRDTVFEQSYRVPEAPEAMAVSSSRRYPLGEVGQVLLRAAYFRLADQGRITLNAAVGKALPMLAQNDEINYRMLLDHRAGLPARLPKGTRILAGSPDPALIELVAAPGTVELFSPLGYDLLALALGERLGTTPAEAIRVLVLEPAGLEHTSVLGPEAPPSPWAAGFRTDNGVLEPVGYDYVRTSATESGLPAYASTLTDLFYLAQWMPESAYLRGELQVVGALPGYRSFLHADVDGERVVVALGNLATPEWSRIAGDLVAMARGGQVALPRPVYRQEVDLPAGVEAFAGRYALEGAGEYVIDYAGDSLSITDPAGERQRLRAETATEFFTSPYARETVLLRPGSTAVDSPRVSVLTAAGREVVLGRVGG